MTSKRIIGAVVPESLKSETEVVRGVTFAKWAEIAPSGLEGMGKSKFLISTAVGILAFLGASVFAVNLARQGINWPVQVIAYTVIAIFFLGLGWGLYESVRSKKQDMPPPTGRFAVTMSVAVGDCRSVDRGELRFNGPWMEFRSGRTTIKLAARDLEEFKGAAILGRKLMIPPEFPKMSISMTVTEGDRSLFRGDLDRWCVASAPREPSHFPPLDYGSTLPDLKRSFVGTTVAGVVLGGMLTGFMSLTNTRELSVIGSMLAIVTMTWIFWLTMAVSIFSVRSNRRKIEALRTTDIP